MEHPAIDIFNEISVKDHFSINQLGDAILNRKISIFNKSKEVAIPINFSKVSIEFFAGCQEFSIQDDDGKLQHKVAGDSYTKRLRVEKPEFFLAPQSTFNLTIKCKWKGFRQLITGGIFRFSYHEQAKYTFEVENLIAPETTFLITLNQVKLEQTDYHLKNGTLTIPNARVDKNNSVELGILVIPTVEYLPTLKYFSSSPGDFFSNYIIIFIQHLLSDFLHLSKAFEDHGAQKDRAFIIGIPYSTKDKVVQSLKLLGYTRLETPSDYESPPFSDCVRKTMKKAIEMAKDTGAKILVIEDGGYIVPLLHTEYIDSGAFFAGAVEQTTNGIWRDRQLEREGFEYSIPIMNVAESEIKRRLEGPLIGDAVFYSVVSLLSKRGHSPRGKNVAIMGYGDTGRHISQNFRNHGASVTICDGNATRVGEAQASGFNIARDSVELVSGNGKIIVGATGDTWLKKREIMSLGHRVIFASASSKHLEIDHNELRKFKKKRTNDPGVGAKYELLSGNVVTLLADGYPINFFEGESVPDIEIGFIPTLLFESAKLIATSHLPNGIVEVPKSLQEKIAELHGNVCRSVT